MSSVIISDFEVVPERPSPPGEAPLPTPPTQQPAPGLTPEEVRHIIRQRDCRRARLLAH